MSKKNNNTIIIIVLIIALAIVAGLIIKNKPEAKEVISNTTLNTTSNTTNKINEEKNNTTKNDVVENTVQNTIDNSFEGREEKESQTEIEEISNDEKAINLAKKEWGEDNSVTFSVEKTNGNFYYVAVKNNATVLCWYKVDLDTQKVTEY